MAGELQCDYCQRKISINEPYHIIAENPTVFQDFHFDVPALYQRVICNKCHVKRLKQTVILFGSLFLVTAFTFTFLFPFGFIIGIIVLILGGVLMVLFQTQTLKKIFHLLEKFNEVFLPSPNALQ